MGYMQKFWMGSISTPSLKHSRAFHSLLGIQRKVVTLWVVGGEGGGGLEVISMSYHISGVHQETITPQNYLTTQTERIQQFISVRSF